MERNFRFPIPREERIVMLSAALAGPGLVLVLVLLLGNLADANDLSVRQLFDQSLSLRASFAAMVLVYAAGVLAMWGFFVVKDGARVTLSDEVVRFSRPGAPITGWFAREVSIPTDAIDRLVIDKVRRGANDRLELVVGGGRDEFVVNLAHAVSEDGERTSGRDMPPREAWTGLPLVVALAEVSGVEPRLG